MIFLDSPPGQAVSCVVKINFEKAVYMPRRLVGNSRR